MSSNEVLTVERDWKNAYCQTTILRDENGRVKKIISSSIQQPKKKDKTYSLNGVVYQLKFPAKTEKYVRTK